MKRIGVILTLLMVLSSGAFCKEMDANQIIAKWNQAERTAKYIANEVTILQGYGGLKSREIVYHDGINGSRIEYTYPPKMKGTVIVDDGKQCVYYSPSEKRMTVGPSRLAMMKKYNSKKASSADHISAQLRGKGNVAGRSAYIVESRFKFNPHKYGKVWIDDEKWVRLKSQEIASNGRVLSSSYYTSIRFVDSIPSSKFTIRRKPGIKVEQMRNPWLMPLERAKTLVDFKVVEPSYVPNGYKQIGSMVVPFRQGRILGIRYSNGANGFTIFESSDDVLEPGFLRKLHEGPVKSSDEVYSCRIKGLNVTIVGAISTAEMEKITESM